MMKKKKKKTNSLEWSSFYMGNSNSCASKCFEKWFRKCKKKSANLCPDSLLGDFLAHTCWCGSPSSVMVPIAPSQDDGKCVSPVLAPILRKLPISLLQSSVEIYGGQEPWTQWERWLPNSEHVVPTFPRSVTGSQHAQGTEGSRTTTPWQLTGQKCCTAFFLKFIRNFL